MTEPFANEIETLMGSALALVRRRTELEGRIVNEASERIGQILKAVEIIRTNIGDFTSHSGSFVMRHAYRYVSDGYVEYVFTTETAEIRTTAGRDFLGNKPQCKARQHGQIDGDPVPTVYAFDRIAEVTGEEAHRLHEHFFLCLRLYLQDVSRNTQRAAETLSGPKDEMQKLRKLLLPLVEQNDEPTNVTDPAES
jgi:hypothetical protein